MATEFPPHIYSLAVLTCRHAMDGAPVRFIARAPQGLVAMCDVDGHVDDDTLNENDFTVIRLEHLIERDRSIAILPAIPIRLCARRAGPGEAWVFDDIAEDDEKLNEKEIPGLTVAEIGARLALLPAGARFYRATLSFGRSLTIRYPDGLRAIPVWTNPVQAQAFIDEGDTPDKLVEMTASELEEFISDAGELTRFFLLNPYIEGCGFAEAGMLREALVGWSDGRVPAE